MAKVGRPTKFKPEYCQQATNYCLLGATNEQLAEYFGTTTSTIDNWMNAYPEFMEAIKAGREVADANVGKSLYQRACGYSHPEDKIFNDNGTPMIVPTIKHYPPDTAAAFIWLKNRQPERWRDKTETQVHGTIRYVPAPTDDTI